MCSVLFHSRSINLYVYILDIRVSHFILNVSVRLRMWVTKHVWVCIFVCVCLSMFSLFVFYCPNSNPLCHIEFPSSISVSLWLFLLLLLLSSSEIKSFKLNVYRENEQTNKEEEDDNDEKTQQQRIYTYILLNQKKIALSFLIGAKKDGVLV